MTKKQYICCLAISGCGTLLLLLKLCPWITDTLYIVWDLCAIFGGGVFFLPLYLGLWKLRMPSATRRNKHVSESIFSLQLEIVLFACMNESWWKSLIIM